MLLAIPVLVAMVGAVDVNVECPNQCSAHGICTPNVAYTLFECVCANGYSGKDCSRRSCPLGNAWVDVASATDTAHGLVECSNRGTCDYCSGKCDCQEGFEGVACERLSCPGSNTASGSVCSGHGACLSMSELGDYRNDVSAFSLMSYTETWDAEKVYGCACQHGWTGFDCSERLCAFGDDPVTTGQVDEEQEVTCTCDGTCTGSVALSFRDETTALLPFDSDAATVEAALEALATIGDVSVSLTGDLCADGTNPLSVTFIGNAGNVPSLRLAYSSLNSSSATPTVDFSEVTAGTREYAECNNRGRCNRVAGMCECDDGYKSSNGLGAEGTTGDCGFLNTTTITCPIVRRRIVVGSTDGAIDGYAYEDVPCGRFGVCQSDLTCTCFGGWTGHDCTQRDCPKDISWFDEATAPGKAHEEAVCSNRGTCDRSSGTCQCQPGFEGAACQRMSCPSDWTGKVCGGVGTCESMRVHARHRHDSRGNLDPVEYGSIFHAKSTWDADKIQGCLCTEGFFGFDCSKRRCATGGPPYPARASSHEIQTIECTSADAADDTSIEVTFRDRTTSTLKGSSSAADVADALAAIGTGVVQVSIASGGLLCDAGDLVTIAFTEEFGSVALLSVTSATSVITVTVNQTQASTQLDLECSDLGMCDYSTGLCDCFEGYSSSDGTGARGSLGDCGFSFEDA